VPPLTKEMMNRTQEMVDAAAPPADREIGLDDLNDSDVVVYLGIMAARSLSLYGQVTMLVTMDQNVAIANPVHVYLDEKAVLSEDLPEAPRFEYVRPVLGTGRPQYCAWKDGELWEIRFLDAEEDQSSEDHQ
jgi:hypothetical protein